MKVKTFRGKLADGAIDRIRLSTNNGLTGYKIKRFDLMGTDYGTAGGDSHSSVVQIFKSEPDTVSEVVNFTDPLLMAAATFERFTSVGTLTQSLFFDNEVINQDIFVAHKDSQADVACNYYIELEQVKLDLNEATVTTLKDMRAGPDTNFGP